MKVLHHILNNLKEQKRRFITNRNASKNKSDIYRWKQKQTLFEDWNERTKKMATYIPENSSVLEFGAAKLVLKQFLKDGCDYTPSDIVDRGEGTIVCDLNKGIPNIKNYDIIFFSGVLEYIFNVPDLISGLSKNTNLFIISYCSSNNFPHLKNRKVNGWVNAYTNDEIITIFYDAGFKLRASNSWKNQSIYVFEKIKN